MKMNDLAKIMEKENIWPYDYAIGSLQKPLSETPLCLIKEGNKFVYLALERNKEVDRMEFLSEEEACKYFLKSYAAYDKRLRKYIA